MPTDPGEQTALFRYRLIAEALDDRLTPAERGLLVRELAAHVLELPDGSRKEFSRATFDRWIRAYREAGLQGLRPQPRSDQGAVRKAPELLEEACQLRREAPRRSAERISLMLLRVHGVRVSPRTISAHLRRRGLDRLSLAGQPRVFGRYEADRPNEVWIGDVLHGPFVPHPRGPNSRRAYLFMLVDDHSRLVLHGRWVTQESTRSGQNVLREAILAHGSPENLYLDNGSPYANAALERSCAVLGIRLVHSRPGEPAGRGKIERAFRFVRDAFLSEITLRPIDSFTQLNDRFVAWVTQDCNTRIHEQTGQTPHARFATLANPRRPDLNLLYEAFRWSVVRTVTRTAQVSLAGSHYQVDPALCGRRVELHFDPDDLRRIDIWWSGRPFGTAIPFVLGRHVQRQAPPDVSAPTEPTGIDYLALVEKKHLRDAIGRVDYRDLNKKESN